MCLPGRTRAAQNNGAWTERIDVQIMDRMRGESRDLSESRADLFVPPSSPSVELGGVFGDDERDRHEKRDRTPPPVDPAHREVSIPELTGLTGRDITSVSTGKGAPHGRAAAPLGRDSHDT